MDVRIADTIREQRKRRGISQEVLAGAVNLLDVPMIVLGGEIGDLADRIAPRVQARLRARVMAADWMPLEVVRDADDVAGASGGALLHLARVVSDPAQHLAV